MPDDNSTWSAQVDATLDDRLTKYWGGSELSKSEAVRQLLRDGLDAKNDGKDRIYRTLTLAASGVFGFLAWILVGLHEVHGLLWFTTGAKGALAVALAFFLKWVLSEFDWRSIGQMIRSATPGGDT